MQDNDFYTDVTEFAEQLILMIDEHKYLDFKSVVENTPPVDIAEIFDNIPKEYYSRFFRLLPKERAAGVFVELDAELQQHVISSFSDKELSDMLEELYLDDTADIIEEMPANVVKRILRNMSAEDRGMINQLLCYPKDSAGSVMTTEYVRFKSSMTVEDALKHIRKVALDKETIYTAYITDDDRHLIGIVSAKTLLISPLDVSLSDIMESTVVSVKTTEDKEEAALKLKKYGFLALPVVDAEDRLVGIITVDDAIDVLKEEAEEDFAKMAAITPSETTYTKSSVFAIWRARIPWLLLLMISATFSSTILNRFEAALPAVMILFVPMLMDTGGNSGGQSSVTVIRGISTGELKFSDVMHVIWKELRVGVACGVTLGVVAFIKVMLVDCVMMGNTEVTTLVALAVSSALCITIIAAKIIGCSLPLIAGRLGFDPAVMASPLITTIVDAVSLLLYFAIAQNMLPT